VWGRCLYDATTAPAAVLDIVERTHPRIVAPSGERRASGRYQDARVFEGLPYAPDPLEDSPPLAELVNRPAADARQALTQIGRGHVPATTLQDLLIGATEASPTPSATAARLPPSASGPRRATSWSPSMTPAPAQPTTWQAWSPPQTGGLGLGSGSCTSSTSTSRSATPATASWSGSAAEQ